MKFIPATIPDVWTIELELREDNRGYFARTFCEREFTEHGLNTRWSQCNLTLTKRKGTIRGMHFQANPKPETKLIRCVDGVLYDVVVDIRRNSRTYGGFEAFELSPGTNRMLYIPGGVAHGFQCLTDDCRVFYQMSEFYYSELARGVRWNDPDVGIGWPETNVILSERDREPNL